MDQSPREVISRLNHFSKALGWKGLRESRKALDGPCSQTVVWYVAGDVGNARTHCALQINEHPIGSSGTYSAAVHCIRYRICSGWHTFLCIDVGQAEAEAIRLRSWLCHEWFATTEGRRAYRLAHPECAGYTWKKLRNVGEPYYPEESSK